tara:strand:+ start:222 stop:533 length:312 start_codon:yes stop_codon:yes gene_type:complete
MKNFLSLLNIDFLLKEDSIKNWRMLFFISTLAMISIASGHNADKKIYHIAKLNNDLKRVKSKFVENKTRLMFLKLETRVSKKLHETGVGPSNEQPIILKLNKK